MKTPYCSSAKACSFIPSHRILFAALGLLISSLTAVNAAVLNFTDPGGNDTTGNTTVDQSQLYDYGNAYFQNYGGTGADAVAAFNNDSGKIVWTTDDQTSTPYATPSVANLGNFTNYLGTVTYTKTGPYSSQLASYSNDLVITMTDTSGALAEPSPRFISDSDIVSDHVLGGGGNSDHTVTITFSENVAAFAISYTVTRNFDATVYDAAVGGNVIGTFTTTSVANNTSNLVWSALEAGSPQGIDRIKFDRGASTAGDFRFNQIGLVAVPEPSTYAAISGLIALGALICFRRKRDV